MDLPKLPALPEPYQSQHEAARHKARVLYASRYESLSPQYAGLHRPLLFLNDFFGYCTAARNACKARAWTLDQVRLAIDEALSAYGPHKKVILFALPVEER